MSVSKMLNTHPLPPGDHPQAVSSCIDECHACEAVCVICADACLAEQNVAELQRCISLNLTCADVCAATARVTSRMTAEENQMFLPLLRACQEICRLCAEECERHAEMMEHCRVCAEACRACEEACRTLAEATPRAASAAAG